MTDNMRVELEYVLPAVVAINPSHLCNADIAISACRAGGVGLIDGGLAATESDLHHEYDRLCRLSHDRGMRGMRWHVSREGGEGSIPGVLIAVLDSLPAPDILVLSGLDPRDTSSFLAEARKLAQKIFCEVYSMSEAYWAHKAGFDGVLLKAHESGGQVSVETAFILAQQLAGFPLPCWIQGGVSVNTAAALAMAGAAGVVLCEQLWALADSPFSKMEKMRWRALDGSQTVLAGPVHAPLRLHAHSHAENITALEKAATLGQQQWRDAFLECMRRQDAPVCMGQDIAFAGYFQRRYGRVGCAITGLMAAMRDNIKQVRSSAPLSENAPLAEVHGTRFPYVQGPMTRVSDVAAFSEAVEAAGALPFLALALMRGPQIRELLQETCQKMKDRPWGVGILGFVPLELRQEQLEVVREFRPPFAIIAGGRPAQTVELEQDGIAAYLHVPSPGLVKAFVAQGARKFIFEGSECGGHVGPRTSFILWESAIEALLEANLPDYQNLQLLFAGGIHDGFSASMVALIAAPLIARGAKIGILMGTAYLFTQEAVASGAILQGFQKQAVKCQRTVLLQSGVGHATRCADTPFIEEFEQLRKKMIHSGKSAGEIQLALEELNVGRLREASKGVTRRALARYKPDAQGFYHLKPNAQYRYGMYMIGQVATLRHEVLTMLQLHESIANHYIQVLPSWPEARLRRGRDSRLVHDEIAVVGMAGIFPEADNMREYWNNILALKDCITEVPPERFPIDLYYDADQSNKNATCSRWGGFMRAIAFDPVRYGIPPASVPHIEFTYLIALEVARRALDDAGWNSYPFPRERTAAIFGLGGMHDLGSDYVFRTLLTKYLSEADMLEDYERQKVWEALYPLLPNWTEDSFPGILGNVAAGRIANRLDLGGTNMTVDAACGTSLAAMQTAVHQLRLGTCDVALVGAMDGTNNATGFVAFARTHALSPSGHCRSFDDAADGIAIGDAVVAMTLKRLSDAERDGDRIYGLIKGIGSSSDGRNRSMTAPDSKGQSRALVRAYEDAGITPESIDLIEAHGTGTRVGDQVEVDSIKKLYDGYNLKPQSCAIGSVKAQVGHTKVAAGMVGLSKLLLSLDHKLLPPTYGVKVPNQYIDFKHSPLYISAETRPWLSRIDGTPRRAAISALGFGGTNFHAVIEEYRDGLPHQKIKRTANRKVELFCFCAENPEAVIKQLAQVQVSLEGVPSDASLMQLGYSVTHAYGKIADENPWRVAILAEDLLDLEKKLEEARQCLETNQPFAIAGQVFGGSAYMCNDELVFLFPGQGSQKINMLREIVLDAPVMHNALECADRVLSPSYDGCLSGMIYPIPVFDADERKQQSSLLNQTQVTQPAIGAVDLAAFDLLSDFGLRPAMAAGHSYGEYVALAAAKVISREDFFRLSYARGEIARAVNDKIPGAMLALRASVDQVQQLLKRHKLDVYVANINAPEQVIVGGKVDNLKKAEALFTENKMHPRRLPVSAAFHVPTMAAGQDMLASALKNVLFSDKADFSIYSNTLAAIYPTQAEESKTLLTRHICEPVRFVEQIKSMYNAGGRVFVEVGPGQVLTNLTKRILQKDAHLAIALDSKGAEGWQGMGALLAQLYAAGLSINMEAWYSGRDVQPLAVKTYIDQVKRTHEHSPVTWRLYPGGIEPWYHDSPLKSPRGLHITGPAPKIFSDSISDVEKKAPQMDPTKNASKSMGSSLARVNGSENNHAMSVTQNHARVADTMKSGTASPSTHFVKSGLNGAGQTHYSLPVEPARLSAGLLHQSNTIAQTGTNKGKSQMPNLDLIQKNIDQFLDLQRGQQRLMERFLGMQEKLLGLQMNQESATTQYVVASSEDASRLISEVPQYQSSQAPSSAVVRSAPVSSVPPMASVRPQQIAVNTEGNLVRPPATVRPIGGVSTAATAEPVAEQPRAPAMVISPAKTNGGGVSTPSEPSADQFKQSLLEAVSERTGYPAEMLDLDLNMEAELGIDSIKKVEIFSELKDHLNLIHLGDEEKVLEEISALRSLGSIVDWYASMAEAQKKS